MSSQFVLGTAQLGQVYGIANRTGKPDQACANEIVAAAMASNVTMFDTAQAYGESEHTLGYALKETGAQARADIITKLPHILPPTEKEIRASLRASCNRLQVQRLFCAMLHREEQLSMLDGYIGKALCSLKARGLIANIGISVYGVGIASQALQHPLIDLVQLPASIFDRRFEKAGVFDMARKFGKTIYIRSVFLQGLILMKPEELPDSLRALAWPLNQFREICEEYEILPAQAALIWMRQRHPSAFIIFGAERPGQIRENLDPNVWQKSLPNAFFERLDECVPPQMKELLNPSLWQG